MVYLACCGFTVPVAAEGSTGQVDQIGDDQRAMDGTLLTDRRADPRRWAIRTAPMEPSLGNALRRLLRGEGNSWTFEDDADSTAWQWAGTGLGYVSATSATQVASAKFGSYGVRVLDGGSIIFDTRLTGDWTILVWRSIGGATYAHYAETSDGDYYAAGAAIGSSQGWFSVGAGQLTLDNSSGSTVDFDDLVALPFIVPPAMIAAFAGATEAFGSLPRLRWTGSFANNQAIEGVSDTVRWISSEGARPGETASNDLRQLQFEILEQTAAASAFVVDTAIAFDGVDDYATAGNVTTLNGLTAFAVAFRLTVNTWQTLDYIFSRWGGTTRQFAIQTATTGNLRLGFGSGGPGGTGNGGSVIYDSAGAPITTGVGCSVVAGLTGSTPFLYIDGVAATLSGSGAPSALTSPVTQDMQFGKYSGGGTGQAHIDMNEIAIFTAAPTLTQVGEIHNGGVPPDLNNLPTMATPAHWWRPSVSSYPTLVDVVGGMNATMTNMDAGDLITTGLP